MASSSASTPHRDAQVSFDLSSTQQYILDRPSPYHDTFDRSNTNDDIPLRKLYSKPSNPIAAFFNGMRSRYTDTDVETVNRDEDEDEDKDEDEDEMDKERQHRRKWESYEEMPIDKWFTLLCLMLLLSLLFNIFLVLNGPPHCLPVAKPHKTGD
jgi:hypothetical protein